MSFPNGYCKQDAAAVAAVVADAAAKGARLAVAVSDGSGFAVNSLRWPASADGLAAAERYASDLFSRWTVVKEYRVEALPVAEHDSLQAAAPATV